MCACESGGYPWVMLSLHTHTHTHTHTPPPSPPLFLIATFPHHHHPITPHHRTSRQVGKWQISPVADLHHIQTRCDFDYYFAFNQEDNRYYEGVYHTNIAGLTERTLRDFSFARSKGPLPPPTNTRIDTAGAFTPDLLTDMVLDFVATRGPEERFFVHNGMMLTHNPFVNVPGDEDASNKNERFDGMVRYLDDVIGRVNQGLKDLGVDDEVLFIFSSDNGAKSGIDTPWNGHVLDGGKFGFKDVGVRVPFFAKLAGTIPAGSSSTALSDVTDILPTVYEAFGLPPPQGIDGRSYWGVLTNPAGAVPPRDWVFLQAGNRYAIRTHAYQVEEDEAFDMSDLYFHKKLNIKSDEEICAVDGLLFLYDHFARLVADTNVRVQLPFDGRNFKHCNGLVCDAGSAIQCVESCSTSIFHCLQCAAGSDETCTSCGLGYELGSGASTAGTCVPESITTTTTTTTTGETTTTTTTTGTTTTQAPGSEDTTTTTSTTTTTTSTTTTEGPQCYVDHCLSCNGNRAFRCNVCEPGYELARRGRLCREPIVCEVDNCLRCKKNRARRCAKCAPGYSPRMQRTRCDPELPCQVEHCLECRDGRPRRCKECAPGYGLYKNAKRCAEIGLCYVNNCEECHHGKPHRCAQCKPGYMQRKNNRRCVRVNP